MLTATLKKPNRLNAHGRTWERGVAVPVDLTTARLLAKNPRFEVNGLFEALDALADGKTLDELGIQEAPATEPDEPESEEAKPNPNLNDRIREAVDNLDVDDDESFLDNGLPNPVAVSVLLGEDVTAEQIAEATAAPAKTGKLEAEEKPARARQLKVKGGSRSKKAADAPAADEKAIEV